MVLEAQSEFSDNGKGVPGHHGILRSPSPSSIIQSYESASRVSQVASEDHLLSPRE